MSDYEYVVIRWPFDSQGSDSDFTFRRLSDLALSNKSIADGSYICSGDNVTVAPKDFVKAFVDMAQVACGVLALNIGGTVAGSLGSDGRLTLTRTGGTDTLQLMTSGMTAAQRARLGIAPGYTTPISITSVTLAFQMGCMWYPGIDQNWNSLDEARSIVHEERAISGKVRRLELASAEWNELVLDWDRVAGARIKDSFADDSEYATVAGIQTGEVNTWENLWRYLKGEPGPFGDNRVYVYESNVAGPSVGRLGPYDIILADSKPGLNGVESKSFVQGLSQVFYPVMFTLMEI